MSPMTPAALETAFKAIEGDPLEIEQQPPEPGRPGRLRMTVLADDLGRVQVIHREDTLLDIDALNRSLARDCRAIRKPDEAKLRSKHQLYSLPPVPYLTRFETVVDAGVKDLDSVSFDNGMGNADLAMSFGSYRRLLPSSTRWIDCAKPIADIAVNLGAPEQDEAQLRSAIQQFTGLRIQQRLDDTLELPPLPDTAQRIIHLRMNPNAEVGELADIVESDPSLAAQVVSWASSSFYQSRTPVRSIYDAIMRVLGFELVMNLAMGLALGRTLQQPDDEPDGFIGYWNQSIWMAQATSTVVGMMPRRDRPEFGLAYLSGLLHNFGYLVLAHVFPPHFTLVCRFTEANPHLDTSYIEHHLIGLTREQIGSQLMGLWEMPEQVIHAMRYQKNPHYDGDYSTYANVIYLARAMLAERNIRVGPTMDVPDELYQRLGISPDKLAEEMDMLVNSASDITAMAQIMAK